MIIIKELHGLLEAVAITFHCRGSGQEELFGDEVSIAQRAVAADLERPWQSLQTIVAGTIAATIMAVVNEINARGLGGVSPRELGDMLERLTPVILNEGVIQLDDEVEVPEDDDMEEVEDGEDQDEDGKDEEEE